MDTFVHEDVIKEEGIDISTLPKQIKDQIKMFNARNTKNKNQGNEEAQRSSMDVMSIKIADMIQNHLEKELEDSDDDDDDDNAGNNGTPPNPPTPPIPPVVVDEDDDNEEDENAPPNPPNPPVPKIDTPPAPSGITKEMEDAVLDIITEKGNILKSTLEKIIRKSASDVQKLHTVTVVASSFMFVTSYKLAN